MGKVLASLLGTLIVSLIQQFPKEEVKKLLDSFLDKIEDKIAASATDLDNVVVLPVIKAIRNIFDIEDNDGEA